MKKKKTVLLILGIGIVVVCLGAWLVLSLCGCMDPSCIKLKQSGSDFCAGHSCLLGDCNAHKKKENAYCYIHNCSYDGCSELAAEFEGSPNYCKAHKCEVCDLSVEANGHCIYHLCTAPGCDMPTFKAHSRCSQHSTGN